MKKISQNVYCAFCRLERSVYTKKSINWTNVLLSLLATGLFMNLIWGEVDARAIIIFVFFLSFAEIFIRVRWRMSLTCPHCEFDPILYKTSREKAVFKVRKRLDEVRTSGEYMFKTNNPLHNLPVIVKNKDMNGKSIGHSTDLQ
ncbi:MAG: hypothetical protein A2Z20_06990 [Bdellovibrionales bacterium RBG_16_40_8]|nr:MAG: hypothetical protein A2Z20_06990 [Bdellovibrionales bacterium RBG_16_40_8]